MDQDREEAIRVRAYWLWVEDGQPEGGAESFWQRAEREWEERQLLAQASNPSEADRVSRRQPKPGAAQR